MPLPRDQYRILFVTMVVLSGCSQNTDGQNRNIYTEDAWEERDKWQKAELIIEQLSLRPGSRVADIGCHEGYMSIKLSSAVGKEGKVYAVDVNNSRLEKLRANLSERNIENVEVIRGDYDNPKLPQRRLDAVLILDTYHEMDDYREVLGHIKAALRPGGRLIIVEPIRQSLRGEARSVQEGKHEIEMKYVKEDLLKAGFVILKEQDPFIDRVEPKGDKLWLLVALSN